MDAAYITVTVLTLLANAGIAAADLARAPFVLGNMERVGLPRSWLVPLAALKAAGAAGLLLGLFGAEPLGIAAATGLVLFYAGALATHVRAGAYATIGFPAAYFALAAGSLVLGVAT